MTVQLVTALSGGAERTFKPSGLLLVAALYVVSTVLSLSTEGGSIAITGVFSLVGALLSVYVTMVAYRTFVSGETESIPRAFLTERPVWTVANIFIGGIVFGILVVLGTVLLVIPGLFLLVSLWFFYVYVAVEGDDFVTAMQRSWSLTSGNRLGLFALGFIVLVVLGVIGAVFAVPQVFIDGTVGLLIGQIGVAFGTVFMYATTATAFTQLRA